MSESSVEIHVLDHKVRLLQLSQGGFRTSLDSVLVAAACKALAGDHVLDAGCGVGGAALCVLHRVPGAQVTGIDIQPVMIDLAHKNAALNGCDAQTQWQAGDIRNVLADTQNRFDHVLCNPPYLEAGTYTPSLDVHKAPAMGHAGTDMTLEDWIALAHRVLKSNGTLTLVHRADHLDRILQALGKRFGATEIFSIYSYAGEPANRVVVRTIKDRRSPCTLHAPLVLHAPGGSYTEAADRILRDGATL